MRSCRPKLSVRYRLSQGTVAGTQGNGRDAPESSSPSDRQRRSKMAPMCRRAGGPSGDNANRRLRVRQVQPREPFIGKYVPGWAKQPGIIERTDMEIGQCGQTDCFAGQR
jgi:hypothetical protein